MAKRARKEATAAAIRSRLPSRAEQYAAGKARRDACPRESHAAWKAPTGRREAVEMILEAE